MRTLVVRLRAAPAPASWALFTDAQALPLQSGTQEHGQAFSFADGHAPDRVWLIVPGTAVLSRVVELPPQGAVRSREAVAFLLEDDLSGDSEDLHFALDAPREDGQRLVCVADRRTMTAWRETAAAMGLTVDRMVPDYLALPVEAGTARVVMRDGLALVRTPDTAGFAIERDMLPWLLEGPIDAAAPASEAELLIMMHAGLVRTATNLLQGAFAPRRKWVSLGPEWRRAAGLAVAAAVLALVVQVVETVRLNTQAAAATARAEALFRAALPEVKRVVNPRTQMRTHLRDLKAASGAEFLRLSELLFNATAAVEGAEVQTLRFDDKRPEIAVVMALPSYEAIERFKAAIASHKGIVQEGGARQDRQRIVADLTVRLP